MVGFEERQSVPSVLIVEDNADTATTAALFLKRSGYLVMVADDGPSALSLIVEERPDVILLDLGLPGRDGYAVAARIQAMDLDPRPLIIAVSGYCSDDDRDRSAKVGIDAHLAKPASMQELLHLLKRFTRIGARQRR